MTKRPFISGYSLVETLIVVALFVTLTYILTDFFVEFNSTLAFNRGVTGAGQDAGTVVAEVSASTLLADTVLASVTINGVSYTSDAGTLILQIPSIDSANEIIAGAHDVVVFYKDGTNVYQLTEADTASARTSQTRVLGDSVLSLVFSYSAVDVTISDTVDADVVTESTLHEKTFSAHMHRQTYLRNMSL